MELAKLLKRSGTGAERGSRCSQGTLNPLCERVRAAEHAPRDPFRLLERRHGFAQIVERGSVVLVECPPINLPHLEREFMTVTEKASRHRHHLAHHRPGFFV